MLHDFFFTADCFCVGFFFFNVLEYGGGGWGGEGEGGG